MLLTGLAALLCTSVGCGNDQTPPPALATPGPPLGANPARFEQAGVAFTAPAGWNLQAGKEPLVATITTGRASIAIFRYPRTEPLPETRAQRTVALDALVGAAKLRDPSFVELKRSTSSIDDRPAVVLRGTETVAGQPRVVRSTHVYAFGAELVVDAFAPAEDFRRVDATAFRPVVRSLDLFAPKP